MKRIILLGLLALGLSAAAFAHGEGESSDKRPIRERMIQKKRSFLIKELALTQAEVDALMPILEELDLKRFQIWKECEPVRRRIHANDNSLTEGELHRYFEKHLDAHVREAELERTYYTRCKGALPIAKLVLLEEANRKFAREFFGRERRR